jgi:uncharacterized protein (DUF169 family)
MEDYKEIAKIIYEMIGIKRHLVSVKFIDNPKDIPENIKRPEEPIFYCTGVSRAMSGETLIMLPEDHSCNRGAYALGIKEPPITVLNGEMYAKSHMVETPRAGKRLISQIPKLSTGTTYAIFLSPLEDSIFDPDVIIAGVNPHQALILLNSTNFDTGLEFSLKLQIFTSFCSYATVYPYQTSRINVAIPQEQARKRSNFSNEEMLVGIPGELINKIAENLKRGLCCVPQK